MDVLTQNLCPACGAKLEAVFSRHKASKLFREGKIPSEHWWRVVHGRHPSTCKLRYENLGEGETEGEAWQNFRRIYKQHHE